MAVPEFWAPGPHGWASGGLWVSLGPRVAAVGAFVCSRPSAALPVTRPQNIRQENYLFTVFLSRLKKMLKKTAVEKKTFKNCFEKNCV